MSTGIIALLIAILGAALLALKGRRDHRDAMVSRAGLLDPVRQLFEAPRIAIGPDGFPALSGHLADGRRIRLALIADSLVPRRLPQLWLDLTILDSGSRRGYSIGALARPTGAEFYSLVHELPQVLAPPPGELPLIVRGRSVPPLMSREAAAALTAPFADPELKEAALTPRGLRIVRRVCEGDRGAHVILRQARFATNPGGLVEAVESALADAAALERAFAPLAPAARVLA